MRSTFDMKRGQARKVIRLRHRYEQVVNDPALRPAPRPPRPPRRDRRRPGKPR